MDNKVTFKYRFDIQIFSWCCDFVNINATTVNPGLKENFDFLGIFSNALTLYILVFDSKTAILLLKIILNAITDTYVMSRFTLAPNSCATTSLIVSAIFVYVYSFLLLLNIQYYV